jgi:hypothetical protein
VGNVDAEGLGCCAGLERAYANAEREVRLAKKTLLGDYRSGLHYLLAEQRDQAQANALKGAVSEDYLLYQIQTLIVMFQSVGESRDQNTGDVAGLSVSIREQDMDYRRYRRALARANAAVNEKIMDEQQETFYRSAEKSDRAALTNAERAAWKARNAYHRCLRIQGQAAELLRSAGP